MKVLPRSSKDAIVGEKDGIYKIKLTAPAIEGKGNKALLKLLARKLGIPKREIRLPDTTNIDILVRSCDILGREIKIPDSCNQV